MPSIRGHSRSSVELFSLFSCLEQRTWGVFIFALYKCPISLGVVALDMDEQVLPWFSADRLYSPMKKSIFFSHAI